MADEWYYAREGEEYGPVSAARLKQLAGAGQLQPTDLVWKTGMDKRVPARTVKGLWGDSVPGAAKPPAAPPPPPQRKPPPPVDDDEITDVVETADDDEEDRPAKKAKKGGIPVIVWILGGAFIFLFCCIGLPTGGFFLSGGMSLFGSGGKVTVANAKQVKAGMTLSEVESILGPGNVVSDINMGQLAMKTVSWEDGKGLRITMMFENGKLKSAPLLP